MVKRKLTVTITISITRITLENSTPSVDKLVSCTNSARCEYHER